MRQIVLDTETTGLDPKSGHRVIEIGCVELEGRALGLSKFHRYLNPQRDSDPEALQVHQLSREFLSDKPLFADVAREFLDYVRGAELLIHNANFDVGFLNAELARIGAEPLQSVCKITDTLAVARKLYPGQRVGLDALCRRLEVDNSHRTAHGALLDAELLAEVFLAMTRGQNKLEFDAQTADGTTGDSIEDSALFRVTHSLLRKYASTEELAAHQERLLQLEKKSGGKCVWLR